MQRTALRATLAVLIGPSLLLLTALNVAPFFLGVYMSLYYWSLANLGPPRFLGLLNYEYLFADYRFIDSIKVSLLFVVLSVATELVLGTTLAFVFSSRARGMASLRRISLLPVMVMPLVAGLVWFYLFNPTYGTVTWLCYAVGLGRIPFLTKDWLALLCLVIADVWQWTPLVMVVVFAALQSIPEYCYEAGKMDGLSQRQMLWRITLPLIRPAIVVIMILRAIDSFRNIELVYMMTRGGSGTETLPWYIYSTAFIDGNLGSAAAMAVVMVLFVTVLTQFLVGRLRYRQA